MRLTSVRLTPDRLSACRVLWGDRSFHTPAEFESTLQTARALLESGRARGSLVIDEDGCARFFGMTLFATTSAVEQVLERPPVRLGASLLLDGSGAILDVADIAWGNASGGLTLVVCAQGYAMEEASEEDWGVLVGTLVKNSTTSTEASA